MKKVLIAAAAAAVLSASLASGAIANVDSIRVWQSRNWAVDSIALANKCMAKNEKRRRGGMDAMYFHFGLDGSAALSFYATGWEAGFRKGQTYWLDIVVDNRPPQRVLAEALTDGLLDVGGLTRDGILSFAEGTKVAIYNNGMRNGVFDLSGSYDAAIATINCATAMQQIETERQQQGQGFQNTAPAPPQPQAPPMQDYSTQREI